MGKASRGKWERRLQWAMQQRTPNLTPWGRFLSYAENNMSLAGIGLVGGVGTLFYGPILSLCVLLFLLGLHRSRAVNDLSRLVQTVCYLAVFLASAGGCYALGHLIENHKEHPLTVAEIWKGHEDKPANPTIYNNTYPTTVVPPLRVGPQIDLGEPRQSFANGQMFFTVDKVNTGDEVARSEVNTPGIYVRLLSPEAENAIFADLYDKDTIITKNDAIGDQGMGIDHRTYMNIPVSFSPQETAQLQGKKYGAYIATLVTYSDSRGIRRSTESCWIYSPLFPSLGTCNRHNGIKKVPRGR
jgi:hypothetical protein